jgi:hypothetical protein
VNDEKWKDPWNVANACNNFFITIDKKTEHSTNMETRCNLNHKRFISWKLPQHKNNLNHCRWDRDKGYDTFPKTKKSSSYDERTSKILKTWSSLISHPLSYIYNHSLYTGSFPDRLKIAVVKPLYKKGGKTITTNYRPIPLLTVFPKVFEKANICILTTY